MSFGICRGRCVQLWGWLRGMIQPTWRGGGSSDGPMEVAAHLVQDFGGERCRLPL